MSQPSKPITATLVPHITVDDARGAIDFYKRAFGAVEIACHAAPDGKKVMHASVLINGSPLMLNDDFPEFCGGKSRTPRALGGSPVTLHINAPDVDAAWQRAVKAGAEITMPLADQFWGDRYGTLRDPYGHDWSLSGTRSKPLSSEEIRKGAEKAFAKPAGKTAGTKWPNSKPAAARSGSTARKSAPTAAKKGMTKMKAKKK